MWLLLVVSAAAPAQIYLQYSRVLCGSLCPSSPTIYSPDSSERGVDCGEEPGGCGGLTRIMQNMQSPSFMGNMLCHLRPAEDGCFSRNRGGSEPTSGSKFSSWNFNFPSQITQITNGPNVPSTHKSSPRPQREVSAAPDKLSRNNEHVKETECWKMRTCLGPNLNLNWDADLIQTKK